MDMKKFYEMVIGVHRDDFEKTVFPNCSCFVPLDAENREKVIDSLGKSQRFAYRGLCEEDPTFKQLIPYCIVTRGKEVFAYRRLPQSAEQRLVGKYSIGVGGHMNPARFGIDPIPTTFTDCLQENMLRELEEELNIEYPEKKPMIFNTVGLIDSRLDPVSSVHVAIVYHIILPLEATVEVAEKDVLEGKFLSMDDLADLTPQDMELWTEIVVDYYLSKFKGQEWFELQEDCN
ncbi:MAG: hypothetical protein KKC20_19700 [Proteobacteria bacterium]|nr:hypothetical protein [Pseudomonadota bacterium]